MYSLHKEILIEKFEVMSRAADDCTYILMDSTLSKEDVKNKLHTRIDRMNEEIENIEECFKGYFKEPSNCINSVTFTTDPNITTHF